METDDDTRQEPSPSIEAEASWENIIVATKFFPAKTLTSPCHLIIPLFILLKDNQIIFALCNGFHCYIACVYYYGSAYLLDQVMLHLDYYVQLHIIHFVQTNSFKYCLSHITLLLDKVLCWVTLPFISWFT